MIVPSAIIVEAKNAVINVLHTRFAEVKLAIQREFYFDGRLFTVMAALRS